MRAGSFTRASLTLKGPGSERPRAARKWVAERCEALGLLIAGLDLDLLVSELVTNAVTHAADPVRLSLEVHSDRLRVEVEDGSVEVPRVRRADVTLPGGRGMRVVDSLSAAWGAEVSDTGKTVWAEVPLGQVASPSSPQGSAQEADLSAERLRWIHAVTDRALANLDVDDLMHELLARVRDLLRVDTASVLLLDETSGDLVTTAGSGLDAEASEGARTTVGRGFAGTIVARGEALVIEDVDADADADADTGIDAGIGIDTGADTDDATDSMLRERGIRSLAGVPLLRGSYVIGVLHVGTISRRSFDASDVELLQLAAERVALVAEARRLDADRTAATVLQRSLLPGRLPEVRGIELAARLLPGEGGVGGDWYDVFELPDGRIGIVMGDVVGRGLGAAVVMGRLRSALRAYAIEVDDPAVVLQRLDRKASHFEAGQLATVLYGVISADREQMTLSSAGHLLPVILEPGEDARFVDAVADPPLAVLIEPVRRHTTIDLPRGSVLCMFTDGLVERRDVPIDERLEALRSSIEPEAPSTVCRSVLAAMLDGGAPDDVAVLVLRRSI